MRYDYQAAFSSFTAHTFNSGMPHTGSSAAWVSLFVAASAKWNGINTVPSTAFGDTAIISDYITLPYFGKSFLKKSAIQPDLFS